MLSMPRSSKFAVLAALLLSSSAIVAQTIGPNPLPGGPPTGTAGGDLSGTYPNPTVTGGSHITNASIPNSGLATPAPCSAFGTTAGTCIQGAGALGTPSSGNGSNITNVNAATLGSATFAAPGAIGSGTASSGAFTTLTNASNEVSGPLVTWGDAGNVISSQVLLNSTTTQGVGVGPCIGFSGRTNNAADPYGFGKICINKNSAVAGNYTTQFMVTLANSGGGTANFFSVDGGGAIAFLSSTYANCTALTTSSNVVGCTVSDVRVKNDKARIGNFSALWKVLNFPTLHLFTFKDTYGPAGDHYGWFAQDVQKTMPNIVHTGPVTALTPDGEKQMDKNEITPFAIPAISALFELSAVLFASMFLWGWFLLRRIHRLEAKKN